MARGINIIAQVVIILIPFGIFTALLLHDLAPSGERTHRYTVGDLSPFVDRILPDERVLPLQRTAGGDAFTTIIDDPTYFSVHFPATHFETVELEFFFKNNGQPIIEAGPRIDIFSNAFDLKPLQNTVLSELDWERATDDGVTLYQRVPDFASVDAFLNDVPDRSRVATYHYDIESPYVLPDYRALGGEREIDASLRGYHRFVTYVKEEDIFLDANIMDMNRAEGRDDARIIVRNAAQEVVAEKQLDDDGNITNNQISSTRQLRVDVSNLPEGVYVFELVGTSDIFWRTLRTNLRYVTFINQLYIGDDVGHLAEPRATTFYTNAKHFALETLHADATQDVQLGAMNVPVAKTHEKIRTTVEEVGIVEGRTLVGAIKIVGDGKFAFTRDAFFDPDPVRLTGLTDLDSRGVDYVITTYEDPEQVGEWLKQTLTFDIAPIVDAEGDATFTISTPHIREEQNSVDVHAVHLVLKKEPMTFSDVKRALRNRLPFGL